MATSTFASLPTAKQATPLVLEPARFSSWPRYVLTPGRHLIGSGQSAQLCCLVSGLAPCHATIEVQPDRLQVTAHDPRTWVNDGPVRTTRLHAGDRLTIGPCTWTLRAATTDDLLKDWPQAPSVTLPALTAIEPTCTPDASSTGSTPIELITTAQALLDQMASEDAVPTPTVARPVVPALPAASPEPSLPELLRLTDELRELRRELDAARTAWRTETQRRELTLAAEAAELDRRGIAIERREHEQTQREQELAQQQANCLARLAEAQQREQALRQFEEQLAAEQRRLETLAQSTRNELAAEAMRRNDEWTAWEETQRQQLSDLARQASEVTVREQSLTPEFERLTQIQRELDEAGQQLAEARTRFATEQADWATARQVQADELQSHEQTLQAALLQAQASREAAETERQALVADRQQFTEQQSARELEYRQQLADLARQAAELTSAREQFAQDQQDLARAQQQAESIRNELTDAQATLALAQCAWDAQREQWLAERQTTQTQSEQDTAEIAALRSQLAADREQLARDQHLLAESRSALERAQAEWNTEHATRTRQTEQGFQQRDTELQEARAALAAREAQLAHDRSEYEQAQAALAAAQTAWHRQQEAATADWQVDQQSQHAQIAAEREQLAADRAVLEQERSAWAHEQTRLSESSAREATERDEALRQAAEFQAKLQATQERLEQTRAELAAARQTLESERAQWKAEAIQHQQQLSARDGELLALSQQQQLGSSREASLRAEFQAELQAAREQLQMDRRLFNEQQAAWQNERDSLCEDLCARRRRLDQEFADLEAVRREVASQQEQWEQQAAALSGSASTIPADLPTVSGSGPIQKSIEQTSPTAVAIVSATSASDVTEGETESTDEAGSSDDFAAVQEALEALAARFEVFGELEQRLERKHVELREFQQNLADREAEFERRLTMWEQESTTQTEELRADCRRWLDHVRQLQLLIVEDWDSPPVPALEGPPETGVFPPIEDFTAASLSSPPVKEHGDFNADDILSLVSGGTHSSQAVPTEQTEGLGSTPHQEPPASGTALDLRSELARMFNLPENFAPSEITPRDSRSDERAALELPGANDPEPAAADSGEDNWRSRLNSLIGTYQPPAAAEEVSSRPAAEAQPTAPAEDAPAEDDSIASYMERLLARTRKSNTDESPTEAPSPRSYEPAPNLQEESTLLPVREEPTEPRKPIDKEATRAALQSFRQVANMSARTALAKHTWRTTRTELTIQSTLVGLCTVGMAGYLGGPLWGSQIQLGPAAACGVGAAFVGYRAFQTLKRLRQWTQLIEANPLEYSDSDPYIDDQIERLSHEAGAGDSSQEVPTTNPDEQGHRRAR